MDGYDSVWRPSARDVARMRFLMREMEHADCVVFVEHADLLDARAMFSPSAVQDIAEMFPPPAGQKKGGRKLLYLSVAGDMERMAEQYLKLRTEDKNAEILPAVYLVLPEYKEQFTKVFSRLCADHGIAEKDAERMSGEFMRDVVVGDEICNETANEEWLSVLQSAYASKGSAFPPAPVTMREPYWGYVENRMGLYGRLVDTSFYEKTLSAEEKENIVWDIQIPDRNTGRWIRDTVTAQPDIQYRLSMELSVYRKPPCLVSMQIPIYTDIMQAGRCVLEGLWNCRKMLFNGTEEKQRRELAKAVIFMESAGIIKRVPDVFQDIPCTSLVQGPFFWMLFLPGVHFFMAYVQCLWTHVPKKDFFTIRYDFLDWLYSHFMREQWFDTESHGQQQRGLISPGAFQFLSWAIKRLASEDEAEKVIMGMSMVMVNMCDTFGLKMFMGKAWDSVRNWIAIREEIAQERQKEGSCDGV